MKRENHKLEMKFNPERTKSQRASVKSDMAQPLARQMSDYEALSELPDQIINSGVNSGY